MNYNPNPTREEIYTYLDTVAQQPYKTNEALLLRTRYNFDREHARFMAYCWREEKKNA